MFYFNARATNIINSSKVLMNTINKLKPQEYFLRSYMKEDIVNTLSFANDFLRNKNDYYDFIEHVNYRDLSFNKQEMKDLLDEQIKEIESLLPELNRLASLMNLQID